MRGEYKSLVIFYMNMAYTRCTAFKITHPFCFLFSFLGGALDYAFNFQGSISQYKQHLTISLHFSCAHFFSMSLSQHAGWNALCVERSTLKGNLSDSCLVCTTFTATVLYPGYNWYESHKMTLALDLLSSDPCFLTE